MIQTAQLQVPQLPDDSCQNRRSCSSRMPDEPALHSDENPVSATIHRIKPSRVLTVSHEPEPVSYRDAVCDLCERTVSVALEVPLALLQAKTRQNQDVALARQVAMYLCNTVFSVQFSDIGVHFGRDRTTVSHACALVEDKRDEPNFDVMICQLEELLTGALEVAVALNFSDCKASLA